MPKRRRYRRREEHDRYFAAGWGAPEPNGQQARIEAIVAIAGDPDEAIERAAQIVTNGVWRERPVTDWPLSLRCIEVDAAAGRLLRRALRRAPAKPDDDGLPQGASNHAHRRVRVRQTTPTPAQRSELGKLNVGSDGTLGIW